MKRSAERAEIGEGARRDIGAWSKSRSDRVFTAAMVMLIAALWLATRPYFGIVQDARFYMLQALHDLHPERFATDLYFQFGSQDRFTIFSRLAAPLIAAFGVGPAAFVLTVAGALLWLGGLVYLARCLFGPGRLMWFAAAGALALPCLYATYSYGEAFVSPRLYAEALTLWALGLTVRGRIVAPLAIFVVSALLHPLSTLPGLAFAVLSFASARPLWWVAIVGGAGAVLALAFAGIEPFAALRAVYDPAWFDIMKVRDAMALVTHWPFFVAFRIAPFLALIALAWALGDRRERRFLLCTLIVGLGGVLVTYIGGDLAHDVLIVQLQLWRSLWLLALVANLFAAPVVDRLIARGPVGGLALEALLFALAQLALTQFLPTNIVIAAPAIVIAAAIALWRLRAPQRPDLVARGLNLMVAALAAATTLIFVQKLVAGGFAVLWPELVRPEMYSLAVTALALAFAAFAYSAAHAPRRSVRALPWLAAAILGLALYGWDARTPWTKFADSNEPMPASLSAVLPDNASVYWEGGLEFLWLRLQRPQYFSCEQGTGALFFRQTALEWQRRAGTIWPLRTADFTPGDFLCPSLDERAKSGRTRADLAGFCRGNRGLDEVILLRPVDGVEAKIWASPMPYSQIQVIDGRHAVYETDRFYAYSCAELR
jgi:hypothetical protein